MTIASRRRWTFITAAIFLITLYSLARVFFPGFFRQRYAISPITAMAYNDNSYPLSEFGFLEDRVSRQICRAHGWYPYSIRHSRRKIYDLFMIDNEIDWLNIRLNELQHSVDYFVIVESPYTFDGREKPLKVKENWANLTQFHDKIIYHELTNIPKTKVTWEQEKFQRNALYNQVIPYLKDEQKAEYGDILLVSDVDELPRPSTLKLLRNCNIPRRLTLRSRFYSYSFQWLHGGKEWAHPQATTYLGSSTIKPNDLRGVGHSLTSWWWWEYQDLWNAAWHCSNCFPTLDETIDRMNIVNSTAAKEVKEEPRNRSAVVEKVRLGKDLWDRPGEHYHRVERNEDIPEFLRMNQAKFDYMLNRDPLDANFKDL